jgi:hypothetical protein
MGGMAIVAVVRAGSWSCRRGGSTDYGPQASPDGRAHASTMPAASDRADYSPGAGADFVPGVTSTGASGRR